MVFDTISLQNKLSLKMQLVLVVFSLIIIKEEQKNHISLKVNKV